jgi:NTE family protein
LQDYVNVRLDNASLEQLPRRLIVATTRRADKQPVFFERGNVGVAVRASSAVAGVISPVGVQGIEYEDADESLPVAVRAARQAGAQFVIAVDVSARAGKAPPGTSSALLERDARRRNRIDPETRQADFVIHPDMEYAAGPRASYFVQAQRAGEAAAAQHKSLAECAAICELGKVKVDALQAFEVEGLHVHVVGQGACMVTVGRVLGDDLQAHGYLVSGSD